MKKVQQTKHVTAADLEALAIGAAILGAGGGGDPSSDKIYARRQIELHGPVELITAEQLTSDDVVVPVAFMGAPLISIERLPSGEEFKIIMAEIYRYLGKKPTVLMSAEIGGSNAFSPIIIAGALGLPVLDADSMGRAFPELQMTSFHLNGHATSPAFLADCKGNSVIVQGRSNKEVEYIGRHITMSFGSSAALALHLMNGDEAQKNSIHGSVTLAMQIGQAVLQAQNENRDPVQALLEITQGQILGTGVISDIDQRIADGFLRGSVKIFDPVDQSETVVEYQNENIIAQKGSEILATCPDIISIVDAQTGRAITSESLTYGLRVCVVGIPCHPLWKTPAGLQLVGPRYFGYPFDYQEIKKGKKL